MTAYTSSSPSVHKYKTPNSRGDEQWSVGVLGLTKQQADVIEAFVLQGLQQAMAMRASSARASTTYQSDPARLRQLLTDTLSPVSSEPTINGSSEPTISDRFQGLDIE
jgi:hypothetical protein